MYKLIYNSIQIKFGIINIIQYIDIRHNPALDKSFWPSPPSFAQALILPLKCLDPLPIQTYIKVLFIGQHLNLMQYHVHSVQNHVRAWITQESIANINTFNSPWVWSNNYNN